MNVTSGNIAMNGFTGHEKDFESRYLAMGVRQYDPKLGRFLSVDTLFDMFPDQTPYHYCYNSPLIFSDPSGMAPETVYEIVEEGELTYQYVYEHGRDGEIECMNPQYKKFISKHNVGGGSGKGYDPTKDIYNKYNDYKAESQGRDISARGGGWKGTGDNSGGSGARQGSLEDWLAKNRNFSGLISNLNQLSESQQTAVNEALQIIYDNGGRDVIDRLLDKPFNLKFPTGNEIYNDYRKANPGYSNKFEFLTGLSFYISKCSIGKSNTYNYDYDLPLIMIALESYNEMKIPELTWYIDGGGIFNKRYFAEIWFILAHEIWHYYQSTLSCNQLGIFAILPKEFLAYSFQYRIFENFFKEKGWKIKR